MTAKRRTPRQKQTKIPERLNIPGLECAADLRPGKQHWLVPGIIPANAITLIEGRKGTGKSSILAAVAAAMTGGPKLPGWTEKKPRPVFWIAAEESFEDMTLPRLLEAGANVNYVYRWWTIGDTGDRRRPVIPQDWPDLAMKIKASNAGLVVLDPFSGLVDPNYDLRQEQPGRAVFEPFAEVLGEHRCTGLMSRHVKKGRGGDARDAGLGGSVILNISRMVLRAAEHPFEKDMRCLAVVATNSAKSGTVWRYKLPIGPGGFATVEWGQEEDLDVETICDGRGTEVERDELGDAQRLLVALIGKKEVRATAIQAEAIRAGVSLGTLRRAKTSLRVISKRVMVGTDGHWDWCPPKDGWPAELVLKK